jgi:HEPN domain-containing protein
MSITDLRKSLHKLIDNADEKFLRMVHSLALEYLKDDGKIIAYRGDKSITREALYRELKEAEKEIDNGDYITLEQFDKESGKWE